MNSINLQDTKSIHKDHFCSYTLITNHQSEKLRKQFHMLLKYVKINLNKDMKELHTETFRH